VNGRRIAAIGHSLGGHNALFLAAFDSRIMATATSCGFNAFRHYYGGNLRGWSHDGYMPRIGTRFDYDPARMPFDFPEVLGAIAPRALFICAPVGDANFAIEGVKLCVDAAAPVYRLFGRPEALVAAHPEGGHDFPPAVRFRAYEFLRSELEAVR